MLSNARLRTVFLASIIAGVVILLGSFQLVHAQAQTDTVVRAEVCNSTDTPEVTVSSPQSDSVTDEPQIPLTGTTVRTTQIDVSVNGVYAQSLAIDPSSTFSTTVALTAGTNTIELNAYYSCNQLSEVSDLVVTYEPKVTPGNGGDSSTEVLTPGATAPGVISNPRGSGEAQKEQQTLPERIKENLGLDGGEKSGSFYKDYVIPVRSWLALLLGFLFAAVAILPPYHLAWLFAAFGWKNELSKRQQIFFRFIAAVLAMLFAAILQL